MSLKRLGSFNILNGAASFPVPAGQYGGFMLRAKGTNQAAQTLTLANLGNVSIEVGSHGFAYESYAAQNGINALMRGLAESSSAAGGAFSHMIYLPASYVNDGNIFDVSPIDNYYIKVDLSGVTSTIVVSGTLELFGVPQIGAQAYFPKIAMMTRNIAASSTDPVDLNIDNVGFVYMTGLTNVSAVRISQDGQLVVDAETADLIAQTNYEWNPATAVTDEILLSFVKSGLFDESLSDSFNITIESGSGGAATPTIVVVSMDPTPKTLERSRATFQSVVNNKIQRKGELGRTRAVQVTEMLR